MCRTLISALFLAVFSPTLADAGTAPYPNMAPLTQYLSVSRTAEIAMARSAAPAPISDKAEILILGTHGFETAVRGTNGFVCYVGRSWEKDFDDPEFWNPNVRTPQCWNAAAVSSVLPRYLKRTQWVLAKVPRQQMAVRTKAAWADHEFGPPAPQSVAFMMSKDQYLQDDGGHWHPHMMWYVSGDAEKSWGANLAGVPAMSGYVPQDRMTVFLVLVNHWSDGTPATH